MILEITQAEIEDQDGDMNSWGGELNRDPEGYVKRRLIAAGFRIDRPINSWEDHPKQTFVFQQSDHDIHPMAKT